MIFPASDFGAILQRVVSLCVYVCAYMIRPNFLTSVEVGSLSNTNAQLPCVAPVPLHFVVLTGMFCMFSWDYIV